MTETIAGAADPAARLHRGRDALRAGRPAEAAALAESLLAADPGSREALYLAADAALARSDGAVALATCDRALALFPGDQGFGIRRLGALRQAGRVRDALAEARAWQQARPGEPAIALQVVEGYRAVGDHAAAEAALAALLAERPDLRAAWARRIDTAVSLGDPGAALALCDAVEARFPGDPLFLRRRAEVLRGAGRAAEAGAILDRLLDPVPEAPGHAAALLFEAARAWQAAGALERADARFAAALAAMPGHRAALLGRVAVAEARGDPAAAAALLAAALAEPAGGAAGIGVAPGAAGVKAAGTGDADGDADGGA